MRAQSIARLLAFAGALVVLFGVGAAAGDLLDPEAPGGSGEAHADAEGTSQMTTATDTHEQQASAHGADSASGDDAHGAADPVRGLSSAEAGFELEVDDPARTVGVREPLRFRILAEDGSVVEDFDETHDKRMHAIVVRRDLTRFQHLHPAIDDGGTWEVPLRLGAPGAYRVFADFSSGGETVTLAADLDAGDAEAKPLPDPRPTAVSEGGYEVRLCGAEAEAGESADLAFEVTRDGRPVEIEPYLGADGHLVALREGDLAFLHVHPVEARDAARPGGGNDAGHTHEAGEGHGSEAAESGSGTRQSGPIAFEASFPTAGSYRLFLQFKVAGNVETVAFTEEVR